MTNTFDASGQNGVHYDGESTDDMLYVTLGRLIEIKDSKAKLSLSAGTTFIVLDSADHNDALFVKGALLYPVEILGNSVDIGPTAQVFFPYNSYYYDSEDGEFARKVKYDTNTAYSFGIDTVWGSDTWKYTVGLEYMTSSKYEGSVRDSTGYAKSKIDSDALYMHIGIQYHF